MRPTSKGLGRLGLSMFDLFAPFAAFLLDLLFLALLYAAGRIVVVLAMLSNRQSHALAGSTVPPVFAPSCPASVAPAAVGQGGAGFAVSSRRELHISRVLSRRDEAALLEVRS